MLKKVDRSFVEALSSSGRLSIKSSRRDWQDATQEERFGPQDLFDLDPCVTRKIMGIVRRAPIARLSRI